MSAGGDVSKGFVGGGRSSGVSCFTVCVCVCVDK